MSHQVASSRHAYFIHQPATDSTHSHSMTMLLLVTQSALKISIHNLHDLVRMWVLTGIARKTFLASSQKSLAQCARADRPSSVGSGVRVEKELASLLALRNSNDASAFTHVHACSCLWVQARMQARCSVAVMIGVPGRGKAAADGFFGLDRMPMLLL